MTATSRPLSPLRWGHHGREAARTERVHGGRPSLRDLIVGFARVVEDLPLFLTAPLYRRSHLRWGATDDEVAQPLPGDELVGNTHYLSTRAISIAAAPGAVWPWLVQVGCRRGGFYADDLLDNLGHPSATTVDPRFQHLEIGQWIPMAPSATPTDLTAFKVSSFVAPEWLVWSKPGSSWAWQLRMTDDGGTRLVTRIRVAYDWRHPLTAAFGIVLMEFGDFAMLRRMLCGIKARAESLGRDTGAGTQTRVVSGG